MPRVIVGDSWYPLEVVRDVFAGLDVEVELAAAPWAGEDVVGLLCSPDTPVTEGDLAALPALRAIATCSVGFDHIPLEAAAARGIRVANVPDYCVEEVADSALAMLLALLRGIVVLDRDVAAGGWDSAAAGPLRRVRGTRVGVVGFGRIGSALAARALALGCEVWAADPYVPPERIEVAGVKPVTLEELLAGCHAVSLHTPLTPETDGFVGARQLALMPRGAVLVNTARGRLVDQEALLDALRTGRLAAAAVDVLPVEPPREPPHAPNLVVTPHAAWYSPEAEAAVHRRAALAVRAVLEGRDPDGEVGA
jgi:D-3-phosphoglycerate dehydrogenase